MMVENTMITIFLVFEFNMIIYKVLDENVENIHDIRLNNLNHKSPSLIFYSKNYQILTFIL